MDAGIDSVVSEEGVVISAQAQTQAQAPALGTVSIAKKIHTFMCKSQDGQYLAHEGSIPLLLPINCQGLGPTPAVLPQTCARHA